MIYNDERKLTYPTNTILNDAMKRAALTVDAYSPISDEVMNVLMHWKRFNQDRYDALMIGDFTGSTNHSDVSFEGLKKSLLKKNDTVEGDETGDSYITDEDIKLLTPPVIEQICAYFKQSLDQKFLYSAEDVSSSVDRMLKVERSITLRDNSDGEYMTSQDELSTDDYDEDLRTETIMLSNVSRLSYYLRLLQECSSIYGFSVLQMLILGYKYRWNASMVVRNRIYKVNQAGEFVTRYSETLNTNPKFKDWWELVDPRCRTHPIWGTVVNNFIKVCEDLDINLEDEDIENYRADWVNAQLCTYLATNEEYIDTFGKADNEVLGMLEPSKLFEVKQSVTGFNDQWMLDVELPGYIQAYIDYKDQRAAELEAMDGMFELGRGRTIRQDESDKFLFRDNAIPTKKVFLWLMAIIKNISEEESTKKFGRCYEFDDAGILCFVDENENFKPLKMSSSSFTRATGVYGVPDLLVFTSSGLFIWEVVDNKGRFKYCPIEEAISAKNNKFPEGTIKGF